MDTPCCPAYRIETERLVVRCYHPSDARLVKSAVDANLEHLRAWMPWAMSEPQPLSQKVQLIRRWRSQFDLDQNYTLGIFRRDERELLGGTGLHTRVGPDAFEIGYWIAAAHEGKGFVSEAVSGLIRVAFHLAKVRRVEIHCDPANARSWAVAARLGFRHEATLEARLASPDGWPRDRMIWTLLERDYPRSMAIRTPIVAFGAMGERIF